MPANLDAHELIRFAIGDFESLRDTMARDQAAASRGNFTFGKLAMTLLEVACRTCQGDATGAALGRLTDALKDRDGRYFHELPGVVWKPSKNTRKAFTLPWLATGDKNEPRHVLAAIFNLVRNGQAHQYQQTAARLSDGPNFGITLTGPHPGHLLDSALSEAARRDHLSLDATEPPDLWLKVRTDTMFLDVRDAVRAAGLDQGG